MASGAGPPGRHELTFGPGVANIIMEKAGLWVFLFSDRLSRSGKGYRLRRNKMGKEAGICLLRS